MKDFIIGRHGDFISGKVLDKTFKIATVFGNVKIPAGKVLWVHFKNPPQFEQDEIWLKNGDKLSGKIKLTHVNFKLETGGRVKIPKAAIHTIIMNQRWDKKAKPLPNGKGT